MGSAELTDRDRAAIKVVELAKALVLADNHFLASAMGRLRIVPGHFLMPLATNGFELGVDSAMICEIYLNMKTPPKHDFLHTVLHCVFLHPYVGSAVNRRLWSVACDIAVERLVADICGSRGGTRGKRIEEALKRISRVTGAHMSAEKVFHELCDGRWAEDVDDWQVLFAADDHMPWFESNHSLQADGEMEADVDGERGKGSSEGSSGLGFQASTADRGESKVDSDPGVSDSSQTAGEASLGSKEGQGPGQGILPGSFSATVRSHEAGASLHEAQRPRRDIEIEGWRRVAKSLAVDLQTYSKGRGKALSGLVDELEGASRGRVDYRDFLRQFAIPGEVLKVSDDEFDYVFYTYGLKLYGNLPLIEPLEYREEKRIREFVIVIDTSGSVWGDVVRRFIDTTFEILKSTEAFFERVHVRIIQCDAAVQSDDVITNLAELKEWGRTMRLYGSGGTDFRPAFAYVDKLVEDGEFENLGGLIYFTDGWGTYPEWMPDYKTAFVFYDENYRPEIVPTWAAQIVLDQHAIDGRSGIR